MDFDYRRSLLKILAASALAWQIPAYAQAVPGVVRIGTTAPGHLKFLLSQDQKFFDQALASQGTKVEYLPFTGGGAEVQTALASGAIDVAYTGASPALRLAARKANVKFVGLSSVPEVGSISIVVPANSPLRKLEDLRGKKVAYLSGTIRHSVLVKSLQSIGLTTKDIDSLNMPFEASAPALARGDVDAVAESDITVAPLVQKGVARVLFDNSRHPEWEVPLLITVNGDFAKKYPDTLKKLLQADRKVAEWADQNFDQAAAIYAKARNTSVEAVRLEYPRQRFSEAPRITPQVLDTLKSEEKFMKEAKLLNGEIDFDTWVDTSYVEAAYR